MIYTVTLNPSIDYVIKVDKLTTGNINRVNEEHVYPGGKGINVTRILKSLDNDNIALGFVSGFTGDYIINSLQELNLKSDFIKVKDRVIQKGDVILVKASRGMEMEKIVNEILG